jgi:hypothetical protein
LGPRSCLLRIVTSVFVTGYAQELLDGNSTHWTSLSISFRIFEELSASNAETHVSAWKYNYINLVLNTYYAELLSI